MIGNDDPAAASVLNSFIDQLKDRIDKVKEKDNEFTVYMKEDKSRRKRTYKVDSDLQDFIDED